MHTSSVWFTYLMFYICGIFLCHYIPLAVEACVVPCKCRVVEQRFFFSGEGWGVGAYVSAGFCLHGTGRCKIWKLLPVLQQLIYEWHACVTEAKGLSSGSTRRLGWHNVISRAVEPYCQLPSLASYCLLCGRGNWWASLQANATLFKMWWQSYAPLLYMNIQWTVHQ